MEQSYFTYMKKVLKYKKTVAGLKIASFTKGLRHRIRKQYYLSQCPDERTRSIMKARIEANERELTELYTRKLNYHYNIAIGILDMMEAVLLVYDTTEGKKPDREQIKEARVLFKEGRDKALLFLRWLYVIDNRSSLEQSIKLLEAVRLDSYTTKNEWTKFFESIPEI